jgi:hypothetical protein
MHACARHEQKDLTIDEAAFDAASLVTATVGIDGVAGAFADLANPERHTKIIVEPWR